MNKCDVCGKKQPKGKPETWGIVMTPPVINDISLANKNSVEIKAEEAFKLSLAKSFYPYDPDKTYRICYACWLKSLGVKSKQTKDE